MNNRYKVVVDWGGSGLWVGLFNIQTNVLEHLFASISDACGNELEVFVGELAGRVTDLEIELDETKTEFLAYRMGHDQYDD